jgi:hypothetical protein
VLPEVGPRARRRERRLVAKVGKVVVTVAAAVADDREDRFDKVGGTERLTAALTEELTSTGRFDAGSPEVLQVTVTSYRMRSGAAVFMAGMMAGGDAGGLDQQSRFDRVAKAVAERVVAQL